MLLKSLGSPEFQNSAAAVCSPLRVLPVLLPSVRTSAMAR